MRIVVGCLVDILKWKWSDVTLTKLLNFGIILKIGKEVIDISAKNYLGMSQIIAGVPRLES